MIIDAGNKLVVGKFGQRLRKGPMLSGMGDLSDWLPNGMTLDDAANAIQKGLTIVNSQQLYDLNLARIKAGLAPVPPQYAAPSVNVGLIPETQQMLLIGGAALLVILLLMNRKKT